MIKNKDNNKLAIRMLIAMISGILVGLLFLALRETSDRTECGWIFSGNRERNPHLTGRNDCPCMGAVRATLIDISYILTAFEACCSLYTDAIIKNVGKWALQQI